MSASGNARRERAQGRRRECGSALEEWCQNVQRTRSPGCCSFLLRRLQRELCLLRLLNSTLLPRPPVARWLIFWIVWRSWSPGADLRACSAPPLYGGQWKALFSSHALHSPCTQAYVEDRGYRVGTGAFSVLNPASGTPIKLK